MILFNCCFIVGIFVFIIFASIVHEAYTSYKQKTLKGTMLLQTMGTADQLKSFYSNVHSFDSIILDGNNLYFQDRVIANMPTAKKATWVIHLGQNDIEFRWTSQDSGCPSEICCGVLCLNCVDGDCSYQWAFAGPDPEMSTPDSGCTF